MLSRKRTMTRRADSVGVLSKLRASILLSTAIVLARVGLFVEGFANNMVSTTAGCMIDLDPIEVIMNHPVTPAAQSDYPKFYLAVKEGDNHLASPYHYAPDRSLLSIAFVNPYTTDEFHDDLQFVMDVIEGNAEFVGGGAVGCEHNKRVAGRLVQGGVVDLQLKTSSTRVKIVAGWSTGHEAVRLTPELLLLPHTDGAEMKSSHGNSIGTDNRSEQTAASNAEGDEVRDEQQEKLEMMSELEDIMNGASDSDAGSTSTSTTANNREHTRTGKRDKVNERKADGHMHVGSVGRAQDDDDDDHGLAQDRERRKELEREMRQNFPANAYERFRAAYESDQFNKSFHSSSHLYACIFFALSILLVYSMVAKKRPASKNRRDL